MNVYLFARNEAVAFLHLATLQYGLEVALDLLYVGIFRWQTAGIPLALLTSLAVVSAVVWARDIGGMRQSLDRTLAAYFLKTLAAAALAALGVWGLCAATAAPRTNFGNFLFLCEACGAGTVAFCATLVALRALRLSQVSALWTRAEG